MTHTNELVKMWLKYSMMLAGAFAGLIFIGEIIALYFFQIFNQLEMEFKLTFIYKLVLPTLFNLTVLTISFILLKIKKLSIMQKGVIPVLAISAISFGFIFFHNTVPISILALILPTLLAVLYAQPDNLKKMPFICTTVNLVTALILFYLNYDAGYEYAINLFVAVIFLIGLILTAYLMAFLALKKNEMLAVSTRERDYYHQKAVLDGLTGSYNHAAYIDTITENFNKYKNIALAVIDIDNFKKINDTYGHSSGNVVLKNLSKNLNKLNSEEIFVARYGGEEFVILFFNQNINQIHKTIDKIRTKLATTKFKQLDNNVVTFSCGIATKDNNSSPEKLFDAADKALYEAKTTGKNKIVISD